MTEEIEKLRKYAELITEEAVKNGEKILERKKWEFILLTFAKYCFLKNRLENELLTYIYGI